MYLMKLENLFLGFKRRLQQKQFGRLRYWNGSEMKALSPNV